MTRAIVVPPQLSAAALDELKAWLGITTSRDDAELVTLLHAALDLCEAFTGTKPLISQCEERFVATLDWHVLAANPVQAITAVEAVDSAGSRTPLPVADYAIDLDADGAGRVLVFRQPDVGHVMVSYTAGLATEWMLLPVAIRHGLVRFAAHEHRQRDSGPTGAGSTGAGSTGDLPAAVAALWRPWRRIRLV